MAPKTSEQFQEIRKSTTATIKEAALELFAKNGYHSTSISQIAKVAGVSKGLMYNYFDSKEALLKEIILEAVDKGAELMEKSLESTADPYKQLAGIVEMSIQWVTGNLHYWKLMTSLAFQTDVLKGLEGVLQETQTKAITQTVDIFQRLGAEKPLEEAMLFGAVLDGMMLHYMQMEDQYPMDTMKKHVLEKFKPKKQS